MVINRKEYEIIKDISKITLSDYKITLVEKDKYWVPEESIMYIIDELKHEYDYVVEELEDAKNNNKDERDLDFIWEKNKYDI